MQRGIVAVLMSALVLLLPGSAQADDRHCDYGSVWG